MPSPTFEIVTLSVCVDCLMFIANGDLPETLDPEASLFAAKLIAKYWDEEDNFDPEDIHGEYGNWPSAAGWHLHAGATDEDGTEIEDDEFSSARCEGCSSSLAGSRHPATAMRPQMKVEVHYSDDCWNEDGENVNPWCDDTIDPATIAQTVTLICREAGRAEDDGYVLGSTWEILDDGFAYTVVCEFKADQICSELRAEGYAVTEDPNTVPFHS